MHFGRLLRGVRGRCARSGLRDARRWEPCGRRRVHRGRRHWGRWPGLAGDLLQHHRNLELLVCAAMLELRRQWGVLQRLLHGGWGRWVSRRILLRAPGRRLRVRQRVRGAERLSRGRHLRQLRGRLAVFAGLPDPRRHLRWVHDLQRQFRRLHGSRKSAVRAAVQRGEPVHDEPHVRRGTGGR